jgi:hypothetical protein
MQNRSATPGHVLAAAGGAGLAASLWLPWYTIDIPQAALNSVTQLSQQFGALGNLIRSGAALISQLGPFHLTAWDSYKTVPAVLLVVAIIGGGLAVLALSDRAGNTAQLTALAGSVATALVGYRIAVPPGQGGFVHPAWGIYLALVSAGAMLAGGFVAKNARPTEPQVMTLLPTPPLAPQATTPLAPQATTPLAPQATDPWGTPAASAATTVPAESWPAAGSVPPPAA